MSSSLHLRYDGKIKRFDWPVKPENALQTIAYAYSINPDNIAGFKDKKGTIHNINYLLDDPEEACKQSFKVIVETEDKRGQISARSQHAKNIQFQNQTFNQNSGLMLITNFTEFERIFLKNSPNGLFIIFVLNERQQLDGIAARASNLITQFSDKYDFFTYFYSEPADDLSIVSNHFPLILIYHGEKRLIEVPFGSNEKNLLNLLERIQPQPTVAREAQETQTSSKRNSSIDLALKQLEALYRQNEVIEIEYYYTKTSLLENQADASAVFARYAKTGDLDQLKSAIEDLTAREPRLSTQGAASAKQEKTHAPVMKQNFVRPETSEGRPKSQKPQPRRQLSLVQEKLIETTEDLESKQLLNDRAASLIKNLILEKNTEVIELMEAYDADVDDEQELGYKLNRLVEKQSINQDYSRERKAEAYERPPSQGGASYFLENKSKRGGREHLFEKETTARNEDVSPVRRQQQIADLAGALKNATVVRNLSADQYGMVIWMATNKANVLRDVINDHGGLNAIDRALPNVLLLADKELNSTLRGNFNEKQKAYINENKNNRNSPVYSAFQCFKYDQDLDGLLRSLDDALTTISQGDVKSTPSKSQVTVQQADSGSGSKKGKEYFFPQNFSDLAVIREEDKVSSTKHATYNDGTRLGFDSAISSQGDISQSLKPAATSIGNVEGPGRSSGSKYTALLNRDQRADSFKGMFQLKLISSDNPAANASKDQTTRAEPAQTRQEIVDNGTKNSLDAHVNVIIPAKSDVNPFTQTLIDKFYESQRDYAEGLERFKGVLLNFVWLTGDDVAKIEYLYENFYYELFEIIYNYQMNRNLKELERRLKEDILTVDLDNISIASTSPRERKRMTTYHSFKALLQNLRNENYVSEKQYKTYLYLYTEEDVTVLAAYEVFQLTRDIPDFIDTLLLIEKVQFFKNESKYFEDISNFNDLIEYQLRIIFSLKRYLNSDTRATLEKIIRSGDSTIIQIYQEYKKNRDNKNKNKLIHKLVNFADENKEVVKNYERSIVQNRVDSEQKNVRRRELVENFEYGRLLPEVKYFDLLYSSIDKDEELIHSIFEIYDFTKDKIDFIENISLVYKYLYRRNALDVLDKNKEQFDMTEEDIDQIEAMYRKKENAIMGPTELFYATGDEQEFVETVSLLMQAKKKRTF